MIKIGDFSKLAHVSVKTLHHYGKLGLLTPAHVDRYTGYRYYTLGQLQQLNRVLALKELGFSLEQIHQLLDEDLTVDEMRGMLRLKKMELAQQIENEQSRLNSVEKRLLQLAQEGRSPNDEVALKKIPAQTALTARVVAVSEEAIQPARRSLQALLNQHLNRSGIQPSTPWFSLVEEGPYSENELEVELGVGVRLQHNQRQGDWGSSPIQLTELPAVKHMACVIHEGDPATLKNTYAHLYAWAQTHGYQTDGDYREIYLPETGVSTPPEKDLGTGYIELQSPLQRAAIPLSIQSIQERKENKMKPKFVTKPTFKAVGLSYVGKNEQGEIPKMWGVFNSRWEEIPAVGNTCYGLCFSNREDLSGGDFEYVAASEVKNNHNIPEGMVFREVPEYKYAVFTHHGKLDKLGETYEYIYNTWLPQSGYEVHPDKYDMEVYDERFILDSDESAFDIYLALKE
jgi:predicted transcriptional regulator YdeE/DNA-binding transcriptional MerR regulator